MEQALTKGRVGLVFDVGERVIMVDLSVPSFWLELTSRPGGDGDEHRHGLHGRAYGGARVQAGAIRAQTPHRGRDACVDDVVAWMTPLPGPAVARPDSVG